MNTDLNNLPLRDLHLPEPITWWPPAPGWWGLMFLLMLMLLLGFALFTRIRGNRLKREALRRLEQVESVFHSERERHKAVISLSTLLRRVSLSLYPREKVANLTGERWLSFLDDGVKESPHAGEFTGGAGRMIIEAPYNPACDIDLPSLFALTRAWISKVDRPKPVKPKKTYFSHGLTKIRRG